MQHNNQAFGKRKPIPQPSDPAVEWSAQGEENNNPILEGLVCELQQAALLTTVITSWANAATDMKIAEKATTYSHYVPQEPVLASTLLNMLDSEDLGPNEFEPIDDFLHELSAARGTYFEMMYEGESMGIDHATILHRKPLMITWRGLSQTGIEAMQALKRAISGKIPSLYADACDKLIDTLQDVISGRAPCIDEKGEPNLPQLPQRRSTMRRSILENCVITLANLTYSCMANDISPGGLGLTRVPTLTVGKTIRVEMPTGRVLEGRVAWCRNSAAGIQFFKPLPPDDPLLAG